MAKKKAKKKATKKKATKAKGKKKASTKPAEKKAKLVTLQHRRLRRTGREMKHYKVFRGFIQIPEDRPRHITLFKRLGYSEVPAGDLQKARQEANERAAYLLEQKTASTKAEAKRLASDKANPGRILTERDRIAHQARMASAKFNTDLRRLTNTLQKAKTKAIAGRKRSGKTQFSPGDAKAVATAQAAIDKLRAKNNPELRDRKATTNQEARMADEQGGVDAVRSAEGKRAAKEAKEKEKANAEKAKKEAIDKAKTKKAQDSVAKAGKETGPEGQDRKATSDLEARREAEETAAQKKRDDKAKADAKARKANGKASPEGK